LQTSLSGQSVALVLTTKTEKPDIVSLSALHTQENKNIKPLVPKSIPRNEGTRSWLPQRANSPSFNSGGDTTAVPPHALYSQQKFTYVLNMMTAP